MSMFRFSRDTLKFPQKNFDMVKEGVISLVISGVLIVGVAAIWGAPYRAPVTNQEVATAQPVLIEQTALGDLDGTGTIASYGPPYNNGWKGNAQSIQSLGGFSPQTWWGTPYQVNTATDDVIKPLQMLATASGNKELQAALQQYTQASYQQQQVWDHNYATALNTAQVKNNQVVVKNGDYGPVQTMITDELAFAKSGLLSGALDRETNGGVYRWNVQNDLLFLQGSTLHQDAKKIDMLGEQWGISHDEQAYPGPWWLTPYTFLYQVPPGSTLASGDEFVAYAIAVLFMLLVFLPWIPGLNKLPRLIPVHRLIWRDWYKRLESDDSCTSCPLRAQCCKEFKGKASTNVRLQPGVVPACYQPIR